MLSEAHHSPQRAQLLRALLDVMRALHAGHLAGERFGANAPDVLLLAAVMVGQLEGWPMGTSKLADYVGWSRPSVVRRLGEMVA